MLLRKSLPIVLLFSLVLILSCGPKAVSPETALDTPEHHVANGNKLLNAGKVDSAFREFDRARELDPKHSPAHIGLGLCYGYQGQFDSGLKSLGAARRYAKGKEEKIEAAVGHIRLYTMGKAQTGRDWLSLAAASYQRAKGLDAQAPAPYYYMGMAYKSAYAFKKATAMFADVIDLDGAYVGDADREYALLQKIERATLGSESGKRVALLEKISRANVAALLVGELEIETLFKNRRKKPIDTAFKSEDDRFVTSVTTKTPPATDIADHTLKADIDAVVALGIKGLQPYPDHTFRPEEIMIRSQFAMMIQEILVEVTGDKQLATRYIGTASPFPDLRNDLPFFNAVMTCMTRGIMKAADMNTGIFDPMGAVSGADAVLAIRALKTQL